MKFKIYNKIKEEIFNYLCIPTPSINQKHMFCFLHLQQQFKWYYSIQMQLKSKIRQYCTNVRQNKQTNKQQQSQQAKYFHTYLPMGRGMAIF